MARPVNPYVTGNPVGNSSAFVGRMDVLREVLRVLRRPQDNAIVLYGQRRIGKTSILQQLDTWLPKEGHYHPVYFDLQDKANWPLGRVLQDLARTIAHALSQPDPDLSPDPETTFRQGWLPATLENLSEGSSLVLLLDEFDVLADPEAEQAVAAFFPYLRNLLGSDPQRLQFVFVIGRNVDDLTNIALSLFKGTPAKRISLLTREDTTDLVRLSEKNDTLRWLDEAVERIWQLTRGHPFLTQQLCSHVWDRAYDEEADEPPIVTMEDIDAAVPDALEASRNTLEWLWDGLPPAERVVASALAGAGPDPITQDELEQLLHDSGVRMVIRELQDAPRLLQEWDLVQPADGGYRFRVELLRRWITEYKELNRVRKELDRIEPAAEGLYQAALRLYEGGQLDQAVVLLRQTVALNPNHVRANQLLAEILLAQGRAGEAVHLLERLYEYQPTTVRPRLVQALLAQAQTAKSDEERLGLYERVLELDSAQAEAIAGRQRIWGQRGDAAAQSDNLTAALDAYRVAGLTDEAAKIEQEIRRLDLHTRKQGLERLEQTRRYRDALDEARKLAGEYTEVNWAPDIERLERKTHLPDLYQRALDTLKGGEWQTAQALLAQVVALEPAYEDAVRYLHQAVTGVDVNKLQSETRNLERQALAYRRIRLYLIVSLLVFGLALVLVISMLARLTLLSKSTISSFIVGQPQQLGLQQEQASVGGYLECSDKVPLSEMGIVVYVTGVKPDREEKWRRSDVPCETQIGRQWALSSGCTTFPKEYFEFSLIAILVRGEGAASLPAELVSGDENELVSKLGQYAYMCDNSTPCNSISQVFQVSRVTAESTVTPAVEPTVTPIDSPTPSLPPNALTPTFTHPITLGTPSLSPSPTSPPVRATMTPTHTATATPSPPTNTSLPPAKTNTPTPINTKPPPPTNTKPPPPTNTRLPPPTNTPSSSR